MTWLPFLRAGGAAERRRSAAEPAVAGPVEIRHRHPAMAGLDVPPVHGWHCICDRCTRQTHNHE
jgi:hypothetical protein